MSLSIGDLPAINATLNAIAATLLVVAYVAIRRRRIRLHAGLMIATVCVSAIFLASYLVYHFNTKPRSIGLQPGLFRTSYFVLLISHTILAIVVLPMVLMTLWRAYRRQWDRHMRIARPTYWIWLYVSVTGVMIYVVLYHVVPAMYPVTT